MQKIFEIVSAAEIFLLLETRKLKNKAHAYEHTCAHPCAHTHMYMYMAHGHMPVGVIYFLRRAAKSLNDLSLSDVEHVS